MKRLWRFLKSQVTWQGRSRSIKHQGSRLLDLVDLSPPYQMISSPNPASSVHIPPPMRFVIDSVILQETMPGWQIHPPPRRRRRRRRADDTIRQSKSPASSKSRLRASCWPQSSCFISGFAHLRNISGRRGRWQLSSSTHGRPRWRPINDPRPGDGSVGPAQLDGRQASCATWLMPDRRPIFFPSLNHGLLVFAAPRGFRSPTSNGSDINCHQEVTVSLRSAQLPCHPHCPLFSDTSQ